MTNTNCFYTIYECCSLKDMQAAADVYDSGDPIGAWYKGVDDEQSEYSGLSPYTYNSVRLKFLYLNSSKKFFSKNYKKF